MNLDAKMCEYVIEKFVERDTPILTVDSFIVPFGTERQLDRVMKPRTRHLSTVRKGEVQPELTEAQLYAGRAVDRDWYLDMISAITKPEMAKGYRLRWNAHKGFG